MTRSILLLDGGMGQELIRRSPDAPTPLWSARVMRDHPQIVQAVHEEYLRAGATALTLNAYSATRCRLEKHGLGALFEPLQTASGQLARAARDAVGARAALIGSLPPMEWSYRPELARPAAESTPFYAEIARLQAPFVDAMLCETMGAIEEARGAAEGAAAAGKPVWVAFTVDDGDGTRLRSGEALADALEALSDRPAIAAFLVNCSKPEAVDQAIPILAGCGRPFGAYANGFTGISDAFRPGATVAALTARRDLDPDAYAAFALGWAQAGAAVVGGCCEVGPAHIARLAERLRAEGYTLVRELPA